MRGHYSKMHYFISILGYENLYKEYKSQKVKDMARKYGVCDKTLHQIFGPKMTKSKKVMVKILKKEGDTRRVREIAGGNIL